MKSIHSVAPDKKLFDQGGIILDVRTDIEHASVSLDQSHHHIPLAQLDVTRFLKENNISSVRPIYTLCRSGKRAMHAAEAFATVGHDNVHVIEGGIMACEASGIPVRKRTVMSLERQVRIIAGLLVATGVALGMMVSPWFYALAGFVGCGLVFAGITDSCGMAFLIAKAPWNKERRKSESAVCPLVSATPLSVVTGHSDITMPDGIAFYSSANGKRVPAHGHALAKTGASSGGCS